jgi:hypothetical protein
VDARGRRAIAIPSIAGHSVVFGYPSPVATDPVEPASWRALQRLPVLLLSLLLHATLLTWYVLYQREPVTEAYAPVMSIQLVAANPRNPPRSHPHRRQSPPVARRDRIVQTPLAPTRDGSPVVAPPANATSPGDIMAAPFADGRMRAHLGPKLTRPCDALDDGQRQGVHPCAPGDPLPKFDLNLERGGLEFAFQINRRRAMQRYRDAHSDETYPGLNCAIFQLKALHLCKINGVDPPSR